MTVQGFLVREFRQLFELAFPFDRLPAVIINKPINLFHSGRCNWNGGIMYFNFGTAHITKFTKLIITQ